MAGGKMRPAEGKEEVRVHWQTIFETSPDMRMEAVDTTEEGDRILAEIPDGGTMRADSEASRDVDDRQSANRT